MKVKGHVRLLRPLEGGDFGSQPFDFLLAHERAQGDSTKRQGFIRHVSRPALFFSVVYEISVFLRVQRLAFLEDRAEGVVSMPISELERVPTYLFPDLKLAFFQDPILNTRAFTVKEAITTAESVLLDIFDSAGHPCTLTPPTGQRPKSFFIDMIRKIAKNESGHRISEITVTEIEGKNLADPDDFPLYNPDPDNEGMARNILGPAIRDLSRIAIQASSRGDLSHNPVARAAVGAGTPEQLVVSSPPKPGRSRPALQYYKRHISDRMEVKAVSNDNIAKIEALHETLSEGDFRVGALPEADFEAV